MSSRTVVFAPDSFKGTLRAVEVAAALAEGWREVDPAADVLLRPMADGGEGTLDAFAAAVAGARRIPIEVTAPSERFPRPTVAAHWLLLPATPAQPGGTALVELAGTAGIELFQGIPLDPWGAHTRGFGEAIAAALDHGVDRLLLAIGSSASTEGGAGMLSALGARFGGDAAPRGAKDLPPAGVDLADIRSVPPGGAVVLGDVRNPLLGPDGAAAVFGPQKGFAAADIPRVDAALGAFAALFDIDPATVGAGAAGGTGYGLSVWGAQIAPGAAAVAEQIGLAEAVARADLVVTGEGAYDAQSGNGKVPHHVARVAAAAGVPVALVAGVVDPDADRDAFVDHVSLTELAGSSVDAVAHARAWVRRAGAELARRCA